MKAAYVVDIIRTPVGKFGGVLSSVRPDDLAASVIKKLLERNPDVDPKQIEEVILGAANQAGEDNRNVARMALLLAGLPIEVAGVTVNRLCGSGLQAIAQAAQAIAAGVGDIYIAGGVESMTRAPFVMAKAEEPFSRSIQTVDTTIGWRFVNPQLAKMYHPYSMGETAENVARQWKIAREDQDQFALQSQVRYQKAFQANKFKDEIVSVEIPQKKGNSIIVDKDEHPRETTLAKLASLQPAFAKEGTVTAGNSSGINDGASVCLIVSEDALKKLNLTPLVRIVTTSVAGVHPDYMGIGPVSATNKIIQKSNLKITNIDLIELNEAFASQALACIRDLNLDPEKVNVNGGSIAIGHPLGASGCRISATLIHEMKKRPQVKYGLATMCIGVGQGIAILYEKC